MDRKPEFSKEHASAFVRLLWAVWAIWTEDEVATKKVLLITCESRRTVVLQIGNERVIVDLIVNSEAEGKWSSATGTTKNKVNNEEN